MPFCFLLLFCTVQKVYDPFSVFFFFLFWDWLIYIPIRSTNMYMSEVVYQMFINCHRFLYVFMECAIRWVCLLNNCIQSHYDETNSYGVATPIPPIQMCHLYGWNQHEFAYPEVLLSTFKNFCPFAYTLFVR